MLPPAANAPKRGAVIRLPPRDRAHPSRLADLQKILPRQFKRRLVPLRPGRTKPGPRQPARFAVEQDLRQILRRLVGERSGVSIGHRRGLPRDRLGDAAVAMAQSGDRGATRRVDDGAAIGRVQPDPLAADSDGGNGAGAVKNPTHAGVRCLIRGATSSASNRNDVCQAFGLSE